MYLNKNILIATMHAKEQVIGPAVTNKLRANPVTLESIDTDQFGTFTGEIERTGTAYETLIKKGSHLGRKHGFELVIASEGSFGMHPHIPIYPADIELMAFIDLDKDIHIVEHEISTHTNYSRLILNKQSDYTEFLNKIGFPSHGVILKRASDNSVISKGLRDPHQLNSLLSQTLSTEKECIIETDMRAMMNPTRMGVIEKLADKLMKRILQLCSNCGSPGFGALEVTGHLPCSICGGDTALYQYRKFKCVKCSYHQIAERGDHLSAADPQYCYSCNP